MQLRSVWDWRIWENDGDDKMQNDPAEKLICNLSWVGSVYIYVKEIIAKLYQWFAKLTSSMLKKWLYLYGKWKRSEALYIGLDKISVCMCVCVCVCVYVT